MRFLKTDDNGNHTEVKKSSNFGVRLLALFVVFLVFVFLTSEVTVFATYVLPVIASIMFQQATEAIMEAGSTGDWIYYLMAWVFPTFFIVLLTGLFHFVGLRYIGIRMIRWFKRMWNYHSEK